MFIDNTKTSVKGALTLQGTAVPYTSSSVSNYGLGFRIGGVVGYYVLPNLRVEGELFYGFARVKKTVYSKTRVKPPGQAPQVTVTDKITTPIKGNAKMLGGMVNAWYDIPTGSAWNPFIGGGIGVFQADFGNLKWDTDKVSRAISNALVADSGDQLPDGYAPRPKDKDTVFAYQVGGGIGYRVDDTTTVQLSYKFQMAPGLQFDGKNAAGNTVKTKSDMKIHLFEVGFRYHF